MANEDTWQLKINNNMLDKLLSDKVMKLLEDSVLIVIEFKLSCSLLCSKRFNGTPDVKALFLAVPELRYYFSVDKPCIFYFRVIFRSVE